MKKIITLVCIGVLLAACKKHTFDETLPKVVTESVVAYGTDSILITGNVTSTGLGKMDYVGFCYSTSPNPDITSNQFLANGLSGRFSAVVPILKDSVYYIKAFAANEFGYNAGGVLQFPLSTVAPANAPCSLTNNVFYDNGTAYNVSGYTSQASGQYIVEITDNIYENIVMNFTAKPKNGVYITTANPGSIASNQVYVTLSSIYTPQQGPGATFAAGDTVYVAVSTNGSHTTLSTCNLSYSMYSNGSYIVGTLYGKVTY